MRSTTDFLEHLAAAGVRLWLEDERLLYRAPKRVMTGQILEELRQHKTAILARLRPAMPIRRLPAQPHYELSRAQSRLWLLVQMPAASATYNVPLHHVIDGPLDGAALGEAFRRMAERHESLRTTFALVKGEPRQIVHPALLPELRIVDGRERGLEAALQFGRADCMQPFDLERGPLLRLKLIRTAPLQHVLLITLHHLICDGVSVGVLAHEVNTLYRSLLRGKPDPLPPLRVHYRDFAYWQNRWLETPDVDPHRDYWRAKLQPPHPVLNLPLDFPMPREQSFEGGEILLLLGPAVMAELRELAKRCECTLFVLLVAMVKVLLYRYTGQEEIVVGSPFAGQSHSDLENQIGFYLNMLPLRDRLTGNLPLREFLQQVRKTVTEAIDHQMLPFDLIVGEVDVSRNVARSPLFDVAVILQSQKDEGLRFEGLRVTPCFDHPGTSKFDLTFCFKETAQGLALNLEYCSALFSAKRIERIGRHFETLVASMLEDTSRPLGHVEILPEQERLFALQANANTRMPPGDLTVLKMFADQALRTPLRTAVMMDDGSGALSYIELDGLSSRIARFLRRRGVRTGHRVAVLLSRCAELPAALLGVLKTGAAYVPLDPTLPGERLRMILEDAHPYLVITDVTLDDLDTRFGPEFEIQFDGDHLAYVIYTSGSTGLPKGVEVTHASLANFLLSMSSEPGLGPEDVLLAITRVSFDIAVLELFLPLTVGGTVVIARETVVSDGEALLSAIRRCNVTVMQATPVTWRMLIAAGWDRQTPLRALCGGEALRNNLALEICARSPELWNLYGPTETTIWSAARCVRAADEPAIDPVPVGHAISGTQLYVLGNSLQLQPIGVPGQLFIGGSGLARGYYRNPRLTAAAFLPDPFSSSPGSRMYATGDLAELRENGTLAFLGRIDHQVKLRGHRIELGDIEAVVSGHPGVRECLVIAKPDPAGETMLCAYVVPRGNVVSIEELRSSLRARLPEYMVPQAYVLLEQWPLTPSGKVDRRALPPPEGVLEFSRPARSPEEEIVCGLFAAVLSLPAVAAHDDFFALGGHSLLAMRLITKLRGMFNTDLPIRAIFEAPTPAQLTLLLKTCESKATPLTPQDRPPRLPLSWAQMRLWFLHRMGAPSAAYNIAAALRLTGVLDRRALQQGLKDLVDRHESLRTILVEKDGAPVQQILTPLEAKLKIEFEALDETDAAARLSGLAASQIDITREIPLKVWLLEISPTQHILLIVLHHIACDAWSLGILARDLASAYAARCRNDTPKQPALPVQYADYALWQRHSLGEASDPESPLSRELAFWKHALAGIPDELRLPADRTRPATPSYRGGCVPLSINADLHRGLQDLARRHGATLFMVLQAGLGALLSRLGAGHDIPIGAPIAGRSDLAMDDLIGLFVNMIVLRTDTSGNPAFCDLLERVRAFDLAAYANQHAPFELLVEALQPPRSQARQPLFQVALALQHSTRDAIDVPGLSIRVEPLDLGAARFDLTVNLEEELTGITGAIEFSSDLFDPGTVRSIADRFVRVLNQAAADPSVRLQEFDVLLPGEREMLLKMGNGASRGFAGATIIEMFEAQVERDPAACALLFRQESLSYAELNQRANRLARQLIAVGAGSETRVGICLERSFDPIVALLAVLKTGAAFLPLDPHYPQTRLHQIVSDAQPVLIVCSDATRGSLTSDIRAVSLDSAKVQDALRFAPDCNIADRDRILATDPSHIAYVIYTSGSTGEPKGILIPHSGIANLATSIIAVCGIGSDSRILQFASQTFDASILEIGAALCAGATLILTSAEDRAPDRLLEVLRTCRATHMLLPPAVLAAMDDRADLAIECLMSGGEACPKEVAARWSCRYRMLNAYGPSEISVCATISDPLAGHGVPIGRPIPNTRVYVLDEGLQIAPPGAEGELYVAGEGLGRGYLRRADLTAERFLPDPLASRAGERMYSTGDRVRYRRDGQLEFLGRIDHQVKVRGNRVELQEIESVLSRHPAVRHAAVAARATGDGSLGLHGFVVIRPDSTVRASELRSFAGERLPDYMLPATFTFIDHLPLTPAGKVDRKELARIATPVAPREFVPPRDAVDRVISLMYREILLTDEIGITDDFFASGGHSLSAMQIISRIRTIFGVEPPVALFFSSNTIAGLADYLIERETEPGRIAKIARTYERLKSLSPEQKSQLLESRRERASGRE